MRSPCPGFSPWSSNVAGQKKEPQDSVKTKCEAMWSFLRGHREVGTEQIRNGYVNKSSSWTLMLRLTFV